jgi:signal peptidase I
MDPQQNKPTIDGVTPPPPASPPVTPVIQEMPESVDADHPAVSKEKSALRELLSTISVIVAALLIATGLIAFVFQSYQVDGQSMEVTLQNDDRLIVWKVPRTWARITHHQYVPHRGDIMIFNESGLSAYGQEDSRQLIKRVIGLPGDRVVVRGGVITIYNSQHPSGFKPDKTLPYSKETTIPYTSGDIDITLGSTQLFMCGDNRGDSLDSRIFGPINTSQIVGKLAARIYPFSNAETF